MKKSNHDLDDHMCVSCCGFFPKKEISTWDDEKFCEQCWDNITIYKKKVKLTGNIREVS